jgi:hypothetical protein
VSAVNTVKVTITNTTAGTTNPPQGTVKVIVWKQADS